MKTRAVLISLLMLSFASNHATGEELRIKDLKSPGLSLDLDKETQIEVDLDKVIENYSAVIDTRKDGQIPLEVLLRSANLEMEKNELSDSPDYKKAIKLYSDILKIYPDFPGNSQVTYQLSRAYELDSDIDSTLDTLDLIVEKYPVMPYINEVQFRRGELLFAIGSFYDAVEAYAAVIAQGKDSHLYEKALYKHGWSLYKDGRSKSALDSFISLLDRMLVGIQQVHTIGNVPLSRGDKELLEDTLRIISITFSSLPDSESIGHYFAEKGRRDYEHLVYLFLGEFYLEKKRIKDAADTFSTFARINPDHYQTPFVELQIIEVYKKGKFSKLLIEAKQNFIDRYHKHSSYWGNRDLETRSKLTPYVRTYVEEVAQYSHALAQKTKESTDYKKAIHWYKIFMRSFYDDPKIPIINFYLAEVLFDDKQFADALSQFNRTAYDYPPHEKSADAAYNGLLAYRELEKISAKPYHETRRRLTIAGSLRFTKTFPEDERTPAVLNKTAADLFELNDLKQASEVARNLIETTSEDQGAFHKAAWTIIAHSAFERILFDQAEEAYANAIRLTPEEDETKTTLIERLAASIYKQGEMAAQEEKMEEAARHYLRVGKSTPTATIRSTADYDAAIAYIKIKSWANAATVLEMFTTTYPEHELHDEVIRKLAIAYMESGQSLKAANTFVTIAQSEADPLVRYEAINQAASLYQKINSTPDAIAAYQQYLEMYPEPLEHGIEIRKRIAMIYEKSGQTAEYHRWLRDIIKADNNNPGQRTERTRHLASEAALHLADYSFEEFKRVRLVEPLKVNLKRKQQAMGSALEAYNQALAYEVAETTTASTFKIASLYYEFSKALMESERPSNLNEDELEQYVILLEEQAYPFEEQSIDAHIINTQRVITGIYDKWIKQSFSELAKFLPARYDKVERAEVSINVLE